MSLEYRETILVVDDVPENIQVFAGILREHYRVLFALNGKEALQIVHQHKPDLILLDIMMPDMDGYEVCRLLKADMLTRDIPIIFISALTETRDEERGYEMGAVDFMHKPCKSSIVLHRVRIHLDLHNQTLSLEDKVRARTRELEDTRIEIVRRLGRAAEYRDNETGLHVIRMSQCSRLLALAAGVPEKQADILHLAAPMHDIGKIGIPDMILLKPGKLDEKEWALMQEHARIGAEIIGEHDSDLLKMARTVALTHHEKWNGSGYPNGLAGDEIPLEGRIVSIADVYDALTSERPYKHAWSHGEAMAYIREHAGIAFDPALVDYFFKIEQAVREVSERYADKPLNSPHDQESLQI